LAILRKTFEFSNFNIRKTIMSSKLCIHGHFYQPPRFDPWLEEVLPEPSAAPFQNWNERINRECYSPLAFARRMDSEGFIFNIINCYEFMSFNFGPTILSWMEKHSPDTYGRVLEGDRKSAARLGHGNAMAQVYHHIIMPLSTDDDRDIEIHWSIVDFEHRYGRRPEGMWLAETAVCTETLEALARAGIKFTILAPRQAEAVKEPGAKDWEEVNEQTLPTDRPYLIRLPSGKEISVFFYDGPLSQAVAFERLLSDGREFWERVLTGRDKNLLSLATDGESYGHHFKFGEMALAYMLEQALDPQSPMQLTNYASFLEHNPPRDLVRIKEKTSWSCVHGIQRWQDDCGCRDGGHPGWNQGWRKPLRRALNYLKYYTDEHFRKIGPACFRDPRLAMLDYGRVMCGSVDREEFLSSHQQKDLGNKDRITAMKLLEMQRSCLASFSSCAWFFDDIARIEPLNGLSYALKGMEILKDLKGPEVENNFLEILEEAYSNEKHLGDGKNIWAQKVLPRMIGPGNMAAVALGLDEPGKAVSFQGLSFEVKDQGDKFKLCFEWARTGEKGEHSFSPGQGGEPGGSQEVLDESGTVFSLDSLDKRLKSFILCRQDRKNEETLWQEILSRSRFMREGLAVPFEEGQKTPLVGLGLLSLGALYIFVNNEQSSADFIEFWKEKLKGSPYLRDILAGRISLDLNRLTDDPDPDWAKGAGLISRSKEIGVHPDLFNAQNRLWVMDRQKIDPAIPTKYYIKKV
jgi:hypothetical protein